MILEITLGVFYSQNDERRLFDGFNEIPAIHSVRGVGRNLLLGIKMTNFKSGDMWELIALLHRYGIPLAPLRIFANRKRFSWLKEPHRYWYNDMFGGA